MRKLSTNQVCDLARSFEGVTEKDHFGSDAFIANGRIFVTVWHDKNEVNLMLNEEQQRSFLVQDDSEGFRPIENSWGKNAITIELEFVNPKIFKRALELAWKNSANKRSRPVSSKKKITSKKNSKAAKTTKAKSRK